MLWWPKQHSKLLSHRTKLYTSLLHHVSVPASQKQSRFILIAQPSSHTSTHMCPAMCAHPKQSKSTDFGTNTPPSTQEPLTFSPSFPTSEWLFAHQVFLSGSWTEFLNRLNSLLTLSDELPCKAQVEKTWLRKLGISQHETAGTEHAGMQLRNGKMKMRLKDVGVWFPALWQTCCKPWNTHLVPVHCNFLLIRLGLQRSNSLISNLAAQGWKG